MIDENENKKTDQDVAIAVYVFFTKGEKVLSKMICAAEDSPFSHMGIGFRLVSGLEYYYEALVRKGFRGPLPLADLVAWQAEKQKRALVILELPCLASRAETKRIVTDTFRDVVTYYEWQLVALLFAIKFGWPMFESPSRVVCSEIVARILSPEIELRDKTHKIFDLVTPGHAWRTLLRMNVLSLNSSQVPLFSVRYEAGANINV